MSSEEEEQISEDRDCETPEGLTAYLEGTVAEFGDDLLYALQEFQRHNKEMCFFLGNKKKLVKEIKIQVLEILRKSVPVFDHCDS